MKKDKIKIIGLTISLSWIGILTLAIFLKALGILMGSFFEENALVIAIVSGVLVLILIFIGVISVNSITSKGKKWIS